MQFMAGIAKGMAFLLLGFSPVSVDTSGIFLTTHLFVLVSFRMMILMILILTSPTNLLLGWCVAFEY